MPPRSPRKPHKRSRSRSRSRSTTRHRTTSKSPSCSLRCSKCWTHPGGIKIIGPLTPVAFAAEILGKPIKDAEWLLNSYKNAKSYDTIAKSKRGGGLLNVWESNLALVCPRLQPTVEEYEAMKPKDRNAIFIKRSPTVKQYKQLTPDQRQPLLSPGVNGNYILYALKYAEDDDMIFAAMSNNKLQGFITGNVQHRRTRNSVTKAWVRIVCAGYKGCGLCLYDHFKCYVKDKYGITQKQIYIDTPLKPIEQTYIRWGFTPSKRRNSEGNYFYMSYAGSD